VCKFKLKNFLKRFLNKIFRELIYFFTIIEKNKVLLIQESYSGSNTFALYRFYNYSFADRAKVVLYKDSTKYSGLKNYYNKHRLIGSSNIILTTHASYKASNKQRHFQLWHGGFIKKNGVFEKVYKGNKVVSPWKGVDFVLSYSETYTTFMNSCMLLNPEKYIVTGAPRNDFLFHADGNFNLSKIFGEKILDSKIIFYLPTFREYNCANGDNNFKYNPFGYEKFLTEEFDNFLSEKNSKIIFKPHPHEEGLALHFVKLSNFKNIVVLKETDLKMHDLDLYELINGSQILITDYSSILYDYLLLKRPIIFSIPDIVKYNESRGFLVESFEDWAPGPKVYSQIGLQQEIEKSLKDSEYYSEKRNELMRVQHRYLDANSSERVWNFVNSILE
jgi:CDP-glycerol glycerophosphotransferase (TagB/SpsB family)